MFYKSEPKYIDNVSNKRLVERYDMVVVKHYYDGIQTMIVLQVDTVSGTAVAKEMNSMMGSNNLITLNLKERNFRIVGQGTFYHKVNEYVGFNLMFITNVCLIIILVCLMLTTYSTLADLIY